MGLEPTILPLGGVRVIHYATGAMVVSRCKSTSSGDRTHDHKIKSLALYHLSYGGSPMH